MRDRMGFDVRVGASSFRGTAVRDRRCAGVPSESP